MSDISTFDHVKSGIRHIVSYQYRQNKDDLSIDSNTESAYEFNRKIKSLRRFINKVDLEVQDLIKTYETDLSKEEISELYKFKKELIDNVDSIIETE
jgi:hypothetical protein